MDSSLTPLPANKQQDLSRVVDIIREHCPAVGMIILFGSYARGGWKEAKDLAPDRKSGHVSDYDILAISEDEEECDSLAWQAIAKACSGAGLSATPRFIHHDIDFVNRKLEVGQYFFLHQTAESCYKTMLLVFTGYIPDEHYLALLGSKVEAFDPGFANISPSEDTFQRDAFTAGVRLHRRPLRLPLHHR